MRAYNVTTDTTYKFDNGTTQAHAVRYAYAEETNQMSFYLSLVHAGDIESMDKHFPITKTKWLGLASIGDWVALPDSGDTDK